MATVEDVRRIAMSLPRTTEHLIGDHTKFRVGRLVYASVSADEERLGFGFPKEERAALVASEPDKFMMPLRSDERYNWVRARLPVLDEDELRELLIDAWCMVMPKTIAAALPGQPGHQPRLRRVPGYGAAVPLRAIDFHVHLPTPDWLDGSMAGYVEAAEAYFRSPAQRQSLDELAALYRRLEVKAVLLAWDAETATGRPRVPNETVAAACRDYPDVFTGLGSVDPLKGEAAVAEVANIASLGLRGVKFHPSLQAFSPDDPQYWPVFAACERHGLLALFHTGTSGIGARQPGGQGIRIDLAHPVKLDPVAAAHPDLTVVAAHFGWPWHMDLIAIALHKTNVYIDISGWSPRRIPAEVIRELRGRLSGQFLWGSDYPFFTPERCLSELEALDLPAEVMSAVLHDNAARILS